MNMIAGKIWNALEAILHFVLAAIFAGGVVCFATTDLPTWQKVYTAVLFDCAIIYLVVTGVILLRRKNDTT